MSHDLRHQPIKGLYVVWQLVSTILVRIPYWTLTSLHASWRPRRSWSIKRAVGVRLIGHAFRSTQRTGNLQTLPDYLEITPGLDVLGVWVEPATHERIYGKLATWTTIANVDSIRIPGYWLHRKGSEFAAGEPPMADERVVLALHGGAYTVGSAHPEDPTAAIARGLLEHTSVHRVFSIEYRLSVGHPYEARNPFPAALIDALAGYIYLVESVGFSPENIIVEGDSAGGNLALALVRYLVEYRDDPNVRLPGPPSALILLSPWTDLSRSHVTPESSALVNDDYLGRMKPTNQPSYVVTAFTGPHGSGATETNVYISPASLHPSANARFNGFPRTFIAGGGAEALIDQIRTLSRKMKADLGEDRVVYHEEEDAVHDWIIFGALCEPERTSTLQAIASWLDAV